MRWTTYNRLIDKLVAADDVADERLVSSRRGGRSFTRILSDWIGIFAIITFVGFAGMFYEVATRVFDD
jgi:hypothetical protein